MSPLAPVLPWRQSTATGERGMPALHLEEGGEGGPIRRVCRRTTKEAGSPVTRVGFCRKSKEGRPAIRELLTVMPPLERAGRNVQRAAALHTRVKGRQL